MQNNTIKQRVAKTSAALFAKHSVKKMALASLLVPLLSLSPSAIYASDSAISKKEAVSVQDEVAKQRLMTKLAKLSFFSADFIQKTLNEQGELLQQGTGKLAISKPNLVNWQTITPDETLIVSDGNTLWVYDPFIEQASAYSLAKSIHNTPILLLTSDEPALWQQYEVAQNDSGFVVTPHNKNSQIKQLTLRFSDTDNKSTGDVNHVQLSEFSFQDATGQIIQFNLSAFNNTVKPEAALFTFTLPDNVRLEDER
jgi:outer membrane lipoprotein carrier protein